MADRFLAFFSDFDDGFPPEIATRLRGGVSPRGRLVFVCSNPPGHEKTDMHAQWKRGWLEAAGISFARCDVIDDRIPPERAQELIRAASCIFLMGGNTKQQFRFMEEYGLAGPIRQSPAAALGLSAGAINMAALAFTLREPPYPALALADITVTPHFGGRKNDPERMDEILAVSHRHPIYAMCDGSAIFVQDGRVEPLGEVYKIHFGNIEGVSP